MELRSTDTTYAVGKSGALSSGKALPYWQIPLSLLDSYARRALDGNRPKPGREKAYPIHNWRKGLNDPAFVRDRYDHAVKHLIKLGNGIRDSEDTPQDNVDAITWFCGFINEVLRLHPDIYEKTFYDECRGEEYSE